MTVRLTRIAVYFEFGLRDNLQYCVAEDPLRARHQKQASMGRQISSPENLSTSS